MKSTFRTAVLPLVLSGAILVMAQPADAACSMISATSTGIARYTTTERAEAKLKRAINRSAREAGVKSARVRERGTSCKTTQVAMQSCTASAYVCR